MDWRSRQPAAQYAGQQYGQRFGQPAQPVTQYAGHRLQSVDGLCYVCGQYSSRLRRVCIHNNQDMLICWVCELCDVQPTSATIYRTKG